MLIHNQFIGGILLIEIRGGFALEAQVVGGVLELAYHCDLG